MLPRLSSRVLVVESPTGELPAETTGYSVQGVRWQLLIDRPDRYEFNTIAEKPFWLFLADANYPGWNAYLDGEQVAVYSAQLLGKALPVPAGDHRLELVFEPRSFYIGLALSLVTLLSITGWALLRWLHRGGDH